MARMKLFYLGPEGTFTHQAAMTAADKFATLGDFDLIALPDVPAIMRPYSRAKAGASSHGKTTSKAMWSRISTR